MLSTGTAFKLQYSTQHAENDSSAPHLQPAAASSAASKAVAGETNSSDNATATVTRPSTSAGLSGKVTVAAAAGLPQVSSPELYTHETICQSNHQFWDDL